MAKVTFSTTISRTPEDVFDLLADVTRNQEWSPGFAGAEQTSADPIGLGTTFHTMAAGIGELQLRIREYERPARLGFRAVMRSAAIEHRFILTPAGQGSRVDQESAVQPKGALRLLAPVLAILLKRQIQANTHALKQYLEGSRSVSAATTS